MSKIRHENPYRKGLYHDIFAYWQKKQWVTRQELVDLAVKTLGKSDTEAQAAVTVVISPRKASKRGDMRGNISAQGHLYFAEKAARQVKAGIKEAQRFGLKWRQIVLEPRTRKAATEVKQEKAPAKVKATAPVKVAEAAKVG